MKPELSREHSSGVEIGSSAIHGCGLFATRSYEPGDVVLTWDLSHLITKEQFASLSEQERKYTHPFDENRMVLIQSPERFVNHSCDNNIAVQDFCDVAIRYVLVGEEITSNYAADGSGSQFVCSCGSRLCRGTVG